MSQFPELPIITPDPPRKTQAEKYGGLLYLGGAGLCVLLLLVAWFAYGVWSMRKVWSDVYVVNDTRRDEAERVDAGWRLARDTQVTDRQKWDLALSKVPPDLARYLLAESLTSAATEADPRAYGLSVARSVGWPDWLRVLLARPLALEVAGGGPIDLGPVREMVKSGDPFLALWARFILALAGAPREREEASRILRTSADSAAPTRRFATHLLDAVNSDQPQRNEALQRATQVLRQDHPDAARVWRGRSETASGVGQTAPELPASGR